MTRPRKNDDEKRFTETLKRMLETPPKKHDGGKSKGGEAQKEKAEPSRSSSSSKR